MPREIWLSSTTDTWADVQRAAGMEPTADALADENAGIEDKIAEAEKRAAAQSQAVEESPQTSQENRAEAREEPQGNAQAEKLERIIDRRVEETLARIPPKPVAALPPGPVLFRDWDDAMRSADRTTVLPQWLQDRITKSPYRDVLVYGLARNRQAFDDVVRHGNANDQQGAFRVLGILERRSSGAITLPRPSIKGRGDWRALRIPVAPPGTPTPAGRLWEKRPAAHRLRLLGCGARAPSQRRAFTIQASARKRTTGCGTSRRQLGAAPDMSAGRGKPWQSVSVNFGTAEAWKFGAT